jgi:hypothetical protein
LIPTFLHLRRYIRQLFGYQFRALVGDCRAELNVNFEKRCLGVMFPNAALNHE